MRTLLLALCVLVVVPGLAFGLGDDVLLYYGNSGNNIGFSQLVNYVTGTLGANIDVTNVWPAGFGNYRLVLTSLAGHTNSGDFFTAAQVGDLAGFLAGGGRLVVIGDYSPFTNNVVSNRLMQDLGVTMSFDGVLNGPTCNTHFAIDITPDPITVGVTSLEYAAASGIIYGGSALSLVRADNGPTIICVDQPPGLPGRPCYDVVAQGDVNILSDACNGMQSVDTQNYVRNLYECILATPVEPSTWGAIKGTYQ